VTAGVQGDKRGAYRVLVEKPDGKRSLRRPRLRWEYNESSKGRMEFVDGLGSGQGQLDAVTNLRVAKNGETFLISHGIISLSRTLLHEVISQ
jgi:hypothetical protein